MNRKKHAAFLTRRAVALITMTALSALFSCSPAKKVVQKENHEEKVRIEYREKWRTDTVTVFLPGERIEVMRPDSSFLETKLARSTARIQTDGTLYHTLENNPFAPRVEVKYRDRIIRRDSIVYRDKEIPYPVEKELNRWQKFRMTLGGYTLFALLGVGGYYAIKLIRRMKK